MIRKKCESNLDRTKKKKKEKKYGNRNSVVSEIKNNTREAYTQICPMQFNFLNFVLYPSCQLQEQFF